MGSLSWNVSLQSTNKYSIELSGTLDFNGFKRGTVFARICKGQGTLSKAKGKLIVSNGSISKDSDFYFGMGHISTISYGETYDRSGHKKIIHYENKLFDGWREIWVNKKKLFLIIENIKKNAFIIKYFIIIILNIFINFFILLNI